MIYKKPASLWRYLRTPLLLTSATVFVFGCASQNPLIDEEADPVELTQSISVSEEDVPVQKESTAIQEAEPVRKELHAIRKKVPVTKPNRQPVTKTRTPENEPTQENELNSQPTGMKKWLSKLSPYKTNIQQGNFISSEMLAKIQPGMTKEQVRFVLGTPLLTDMFHANRWDYLFRLQKPNGATTTNRVTIFFNDNIVDRLTNDKLPGEAEYLSHISSDDDSQDKARKEQETTAPEQQKEEPSRYEEKVIPPVYDNPEARPETSTSDQPEPVDKTDTDAQAAPVVQHTEQETSSHSTKQEVITEPAVRTEPETVNTPASASAPATHRTSVSAPVRAPKPASTPKPVRTPVPVSNTDPSGNTEQTTRPIRQNNRLQVKTLPADPKDDESTTSENLSTYESISTPGRVGRMLPPSPNDELIGNIQ